MTAVYLYFAVLKMLEYWKEKEMHYVELTG